MSAPINDSFDDRLIFTDSFDITVDVTESTIDTQEEQIVGEGFPGGIQWLQFTPTYSATLTIDVTNVQPVGGIIIAPRDTFNEVLLGLFGGAADYQQIQLITGEDATLTFNVVAGTNYQFLILFINESGDGASGTFDLSCSFVRNVPRYGIECGQVGLAVSILEVASNILNAPVVVLNSINCGQAVLISRSSGEEPEYLTTEDGEILTTEEGEPLTLEGL